MASLSPPVAQASARRSTRSFLPWSRRDEAAAPSAARPPRRVMELAQLRELRAIADWPRLWALLRPLRVAARNNNQPELLELFGQCARRGLGGNANDAAQWLTDALWAFQAAQDGGGMVRAHRQLAELKLDRGEFAAAKREISYAQTLSRNRQLNAEEALLLGTLEGRVAMCEGDYELAASRGLEAQRLGELAGAARECHARVLSAEALILMGRRDVAAVQLLWAERLHNEARLPAAAIAVAIARAEALLSMDCPRRSIAVLAPWHQHEALGQDPLLEAHFLRVWGTAHVFEHPPIAQESLANARAFFARMGSAYHVASCEMMQVRCAHRQHAPNLEGIVDQLQARLPHPWRLMHDKLARVRQELSLPAAPALGAVRTPWLRAVGQLPHQAAHVSGTKEGGARPQTSSPGIWQRLQSSLGAEELTHN